MEKERLWFEDCIEIGDDIWFPSGTFNGLIKYNTKTNNVNYVLSFDGEEFLTFRLFSGVVYYKNKLYFIPYFAERFWIYDIENNNMYSKKMKTDGAQFLNFCQLYNGKIIMFHNEKDLFLIFDIDNDEMREVANIKKDNNIKGYFIGKGVVFKDNFYIGNTSNGIIISVDLHNYSASLLNINYKHQYYVIDVWDGGILVKDDKGVISKIIPPSEENYFIANIGDEEFHADIRDTVVLRNEVLYIFSFDINYVLLLNLKNKRKSIIQIEEDEEKPKKVNLIRQWGCIKKLNKKILFSSNKDFSVYFLNANNELVKEKIEYNDEIRNIVAPIILNRDLGLIEYESYICQLTDFLNVI